MKRRALFIAMFLVLSATVAGIFWSILGTPQEEPVGVRFLGPTNYNGRTFAVFALTNRQSFDLSGSAYPLFAAEKGQPVIEPDDVWMGTSFWMGVSTGKLSTTTVRVPANKREWRLVVNLPSVRRPLTRKEKMRSFCIQHKWDRLAQLLTPNPVPNPIPKPSTATDGGVSTQGVSFNKDYRPGTTTGGVSTLPTPNIVPTPGTLTRPPGFPGLGATVLGPQMRGTQLK